MRPWVVPDFLAAALGKRHTPGIFWLTSWYQFDSVCISRIFCMQVISGDMSRHVLTLIEFMLTPRWAQHNPWTALDRPGLGFTPHFEAAFCAQTAQRCSNAWRQSWFTICHAIRYEIYESKFNIIQYDSDMIQIWFNDIQCVGLKSFDIWSGLISCLKQTQHQLNASEVLTGPTDGKVLSSWTFDMETSTSKHRNIWNAWRNDGRHGRP